MLSLNTDPTCRQCLRSYDRMALYKFDYFFTLGIKDPEGFGKKLEENCRSDHYSGQSSNTKESCSSTPLNRCTSTETRWNKKSCLLLVAGVMTNFLGQK